MSSTNPANPTSPRSAAILTTDLDDRFFTDLRAVARDVGADPEDMVRVMYSESGVRADAHNPNGDASGIIQFMPSTLRNVGWAHTAAAFRRLSGTEQLPFVRRYYRPYKGRLDTLAAIYVANFLPALLGHAGDPDFVLTAKGGPLGWAYSANAGLDANGDLAITVRELELAVNRQTRGPRWDEILARHEGRFKPTIDIRTIAGVQLALTALGHGPGPADGIVGPRTRAAIVDFQKSAALVPDGIVGPRTRGALRIALLANGIAVTG